LPVTVVAGRLCGHADAIFPLARLGAFRTELRACCTRRGDALFELGDALLSADSFLSLPHLSLEPTHRRGWGSAYAALACGRIDAERLRDLLVTSLPAADPLVFAVDVTTWPRCDAECSPQRGYYYHPSRHSAGQPIVAGWAFQWVCQLSFDRDSWTAPVDARRLHPLDDTDQTTWPAPTATLGCHDHQYGTVTVQAWAGLHPKQQRHPRHGTGGPRPIVRGTIIRVQVERVPARTRPPKVLWLWWAGPGDLDLELAWRAYIRRFDLEHTVRLCKQTLGWTTPRPRHPEQADRWTWLVLAAYTQLRLARQVVVDARLPWDGCGHRRGCHPTGCGAGFRDCCAHWAPRPARRNPQALPGPPQGQPPRACDPLPGGQKAHQQAQEEQEEGDHHRQGRLTDPPSPPSDRRPRSTASSTCRRVKSQG